MKKTFKRILCIVLAAVLVASLAGCAKINYITNGTIKAINEVKSGDWKNGGAEGGEEGGASDINKDDIKIEELTPGTYGGVDFQNLEDVAKFYKEAYDYTKSLTADYIDDQGATQKFYKLLGDEKLKIGDVIIDGSANAIVNKLVPGIVDSMFKPNIYGLPPCYNRNPDLDNNKDDEHKKADHDFRTTEITAEDILAANVKDNGDGTITLVIQPKMAQMSTRGDDSQGRFFEVLGDIGGVVAGIKAVSFTEGTAEDNVKVYYKGGKVTVKVDAKSKEILEGDYVMETTVQVDHASVAVIKDKSATLTITYINHYPASDQYLKDTKGVTRK
ncbi:MAG: hypothetical protein IKI34_00880 [Eubacterium sp.]|nr:hypothetical protein [Eubacterium sp.]MBR7060277.1 hypothetical protein [Eubacterium sp.]